MQTRLHFFDVSIFLSPGNTFLWSTVPDWHWDHPTSLPPPPCSLLHVTPYQTISFIAFYSWRGFPITSLLVLFCLNSFSDSVDLSDFMIPLFSIFSKAHIPKGPWGETCCSRSLSSPSQMDRSIGFDSKESMLKSQHASLHIVSPWSEPVEALVSTVIIESDDTQTAFKHLIKWIILTSDSYD